MSGLTKEQIINEVSEMPWSQFKPLLADAVVAHLSPIQAKYREVMQDEAYLNSVLLEGQLAAEEIADETLLWAKTAMGLLIPPSKK